MKMSFLIEKHPACYLTALAYHPGAKMPVTDTDVVFDTEWTAITDFVALIS